ncbi:DUF1330 domain-containing protein [Pararhizobium sp. A13]|uniref:DUF1330 domain-containing protein n=1 Tax=Pararhizobium sp. A13 TaxID=3133975 RepID=UPI00311AD1E4
MSAYYIFQENLHDPAKFEAYRKVVMSTLAPFEGRIIARGGELTVVEGEWPFDRTVILEFPSRTAAEAWYNSPAYQVILPLRLQSMMCNAILIDGVG